MTAYVATTSFSFNGSTTASLAVRAGTFEMKINKVDFGITVQNTGSVGGVGGMGPSIKRFSSGTISGSTSVTPQPLRQGSLATTATARGVTVSVSGSGTLIATAAGLTASADPGFGFANSTYEPPFDFTVSPGGVFQVVVDCGANGTTSATGTITAYYEELRLSWHY